MLRYVMLVHYECMFVSVKQKMYISICTVNMGVSENGGI